ncbi:competence protein CoiA [Jeotgalibacillus sp. ET6]|uniref:competence protein CoiA n=1 Tax=Jeotgalibacillus sp. ET6 TaxID=3037260 RepID=UPI003FA53C46
MFLDGSKTRDELRELQNNMYFCPQCSDNVILKVGDLKIPHFSHKASNTCKGFSEPESPEHLEAKLQLYKWLKNSAEQAEVEKIYPDFNQRADIGVRLRGKDYAIEFQRSRIAPRDFIKRTEEYTSNNVVPVWLLSHDVLKKPLKNKISLSSFHQQFIRYSPSLKQFFLVSYDHVHQSFSTLHYLIPLSSSAFLSSNSSFPLTHVEFPHFSLQPLFYSEKELNILKEQRKRWLKSRLVYGKGCVDGLLSLLYQQGTNLQVLPPWVGVPVRHSLFIKEPDAEWQCYLYLLLMESEEKSLTLNDMVKKMNDYIDLGYLSLRQIQFRTPGRLLMAVTEYLNILQKIGIVERQQKGYTLCWEHPYVSIDQVLDIKRTEEQFWMQYQNLLLETLNK